MEVKTEQLNFNIKRAVLNQEEFDLKYGYIKTGANLGKLMRKKVTGCTQYNFINRIKHVLPILSWLPNVNGSDLLKDSIAGITVGILCVPQGSVFNCYNELEFVDYC
ncbi:unnamed protein product [Litomosoides sigmodontis]|uniref:SLC26A/SulP transporter domain-containing protein n=1 Tax=Litomosoides sigmodontis TaxID=42156 RepID=A0A3P6UZB0_LITSI|nr:unnamed protein product [Litomosoides sigmodontis]